MFFIWHCCCVFLCDAVNFELPFEMIPFSLKQSCQFICIAKFNFLTNCSSFVLFACSHGSMLWIFSFLFNWILNDQQQRCFTIAALVVVIVSSNRFYYFLFRFSLSLLSLIWYENQNHCLVSLSVCRSFTMNSLFTS